MTRRGTPPARPLAAALAVAVVAVVVVTSATTLPPSATLAAYSDTTTAGSGSLGAHRVVSHATPSCTDVGVSTARVSWVKNDARYSYEWEVRTTGGELLAAGTVGATAQAGATVGIDIGPPTLLSGSRNLDVTVRARLAGVAWRAATATTTRVRQASLLVVGLVTRCGSL